MLTLFSSRNFHKKIHKHLLLFIRDYNEIVSKRVLYYNFLILCTCNRFGNKICYIYCLFPLRPAQTFSFICTFYLVIMSRVAGGG